MYKNLELTTDDYSALRHFRSQYPTWWYKIGVCDVSWDFDCAPQARSLEIKYIESGQWPDRCFTCDSQISLAHAIYSVMGEIQELLAEKGEGDYA